MSASIAIWDKALKVAKVQAVKNNKLSRMGFGLEGCLCLFPEEALYLLHHGDIVLLRDKPMQESETELPTMSLVEGFRELIDSTGLSLEAYYTYSKLKQQGCIVFRHNFHLCGKSEPVSWSDLNLPSVFVPSETTNSSADISAVHESNGNDTNPGVSISFDVYQPNARFSKSNMGPPSSCVVVCSVTSQMPPPQLLEHTCASLNSGTRLFLSLATNDSSANTTFLEVGAVTDIHVSNFG